MPVPVMPSAHDTGERTTRGERMFYGCKGVRREKGEGVVQRELTGTEHREQSAGAEAARSDDEGGGYDEPDDAGKHAGVGERATAEDVGCPCETEQHHGERKRSQQARQAAVGSQHAAILREARQGRRGASGLRRCNQKRIFVACNGRPAPMVSSWRARSSSAYSSTLKSSGASHGTRCR